MDRRLLALKATQQPGAVTRLGLAKVVFCGRILRCRKSMVYVPICPAPNFIFTFVPYLYLIFCIGKWVPLARQTVSEASTNPG